MDLGFKINWSIVWGNHGASGGYPQNAGVLVVLVSFRSAVFSYHDKAIMFWWSVSLQDMEFFLYNDVIMGSMASQIASLTIIYSTVYSGADQRQHQNSASLAFVRGIHRGPVNSPRKWPVTRKMFQFDDVIMSHVAERTFFKDVCSATHMTELQRLWIIPYVCSLWNVSIYLRQLERWWYTR